MKRLRTKIVLALVACIGITAVIIGTYLIYNLVVTAEEDIKSYKETLYAQFDQKVKMEVETCISVIDQYYKKQQAGEMTEAEAKKAAADMVRQLRFDNGNYFWVDTKEGINVVLLGKDTEGKSRYSSQDALGVYYVQEFIKNGTKEGGGYTDYQFPRPNQTEPLPKRSYTLLYQPYGWVVGTGNYLDDINNVVSAEEKVKKDELTKDIIMLLVIVIISLGISILIGFVFSRKITKPIITMAQSVSRLADGDLRIDKLNISSNDEIGELASGFNKMADNLRELVTRVMGTSTQLSSASEQLAAGAEQLATAASSVAASISEVSSGTERQINAVDQVSQVVEDLNKTFKTIISDVKDVTAVSDQTASTAQKESQNIDKTIKQMSNIEEATNHAAELVDNLGSRSREIGTIVNTISDIAEQTNLLALNAAIEAARAGEQGRGFAVVADEVRKLAEQSQMAAKQISELIRQIQYDTDQAVKAMNNGTTEVRVGTEAVNIAGRTFKDIAELINNVSEKVRYSASRLVESSEGNEKIASAVLEVDQISQEIAAQTQAVNAAIEEQTASSEEIASSSHLLMKDAEEMQNILKRFKL